jgi:membrane fusion protein, multidrug efflux system
MNATTIAHRIPEGRAANPVNKDTDSPDLQGSGVKTWATRVAIGIAITAILAAGAMFGERYWTVGRFIQSTDDAYVQADSSTIAPKVSGYIASVLINDNQAVKSGQILARIDDADLRTALDEANANVSAARATLANLTAQLTAQASVIGQARANVAVAKIELDLSKRNDARRREMAKVGFGSDEQSDDASADYRAKTSLVTREEAAATTSAQQVDVLKAQRDLAQAQLARAQALKHQAELNLSYATIQAPIDGTVGARSIRVGQYVQAGTQLMELVPLAKTYVVANFKETQLTNVRAGQPVRIAVDAFPADDLQARVESIAPASGMEFSLLPPDNATGNFTKIVQRIPVKIAIDNAAEFAGGLRPGMSVDVSIDTKETANEGRQHPATKG